MKEATLQNDPNIRMPAAVRAAAARSDEIVNAINAQNGNTPVTSEGNPQEPIVAPAPPPAPAPAPAAAPAPAPAPASAAPPEGEESWEHKYKSMKGRYDRSQEQIKMLSEQVSGMQNVIATLQTQAPPAAPATEPKLEKFVTPEEEKDYGSDFLNVVAKKAKEELNPVILKQQQEIEALKRQLAGVASSAQQSTQASLLAKLDEKLPTWRDLNQNEDFLAWLRLPDPYSGDIRHELLKKAYAQGNASRVLQFFNGFLAEEAALAPAGSEPNVPTEKVEKVPLANLAAPGRAKTAAGNVAPAEKPIFTRAQIAAFYAEVAAGKYRGRDEAKNQIESQIFLAQREGRISN